MAEASALEGNFAVCVIKVCGTLILILGVPAHNEDGLLSDEVIPADEVGVYQGGGAIESSISGGDA
ncbi:hypothetical protein ES708_10948 [subsurface metagenome]